MKHKRFFNILFMVILISAIVVAYLTSLLTLLINWFSVLSDRNEKLKTDIGIIATILSIFMYAKLRFWDTRILNKIQKIYGKQRFIESIVLILEMLKVLDPDQIITKIQLLNRTEIDMRKAVKDIKDILSGGETQKEYKLNLSRIEQKKLSNKINLLLALLDKELDIHYLHKDLGIHKKKNKELAEIKRKIEEKGKKKLISYFKQ